MKERTMSRISGFLNYLAGTLLCWSIIASAGNGSDEAAVSSLKDVPNLKARIQSYQEAHPLDEGLSEEDRALLMRGLDEVEARMPEPGLKPGDIAPDFML